jgi:hypothetical protein
MEGMTGLAVRAVHGTLGVARRLEEPDKSLNMCYILLHGTRTMDWK